MRIVYNDFIPLLGTVVHHSTGGVGVSGDSPTPDFETTISGSVQMAMVSPQQAAQNWSSGMSGAGAKAKAGVQAVTNNPAQAAIAAIPRQVQGVIDAANSGKTAAGLASVTLQSWQAAYINKGLPRMASGAQAAVGKMQQFMGQFLPYLQTAVAGLPPRGDLQTNIQRAVAMMNANAQFKFQKTAM